jgi:hypothetical protein
VSYFCSGFSGGYSSKCGRALSTLNLWFNGDDHYTKDFGTFSWPVKQNTTVPSNFVLHISKLYIANMAKVRRFEVISERSKQWKSVLEKTRPICTEMNNQPVKLLAYKTKIE